MLRVPHSTITPPALPPKLVDRPALRTALDAGADRALTLVCAPPGYGKTVLLTEWVRRTPDVPTAWVNLDEDHDDPVRLWSSVLAALCACPAVPRRSRLHRLAVSHFAVDLDFFSDLLDCLDALPQRIRLVLDDAHHVESPASLHGLQMIVRSPRRSIRLVLASRRDPVLPVARLRMEQQLCELRAEQLRLTAAEAAELLEQCGLRLARRQRALLHARTGGWPAGLRLATLPLRDHPDRKAFVEAFSGDERPVADYLVGEVLSRLTADEIDLLRRVSICDPVPGGLAVELAERDDAAEILDELAQRTGLVTTTGRRRDEYRTQALLRSYLLADLMRHGPDTTATLHARALRWCAGSGRPLDALQHAGGTHDPSLPADLLRRWAPELAARGEHEALQRALTAGGRPGTPDADSWHAVITAQVLFGRGDRAGAVAALRATERRTERRSTERRDPPDLRLALFRTATERLAGLGPTPSPDIDAAVPDDPALAALALAGRGAAQLRGGDLVSGRSLLGDALDQARRLHLELLEVQCLCLLGGAALTAGDHRAAAATASAGVAAAINRGWQRSAWAAEAHAVAAHAALVRGRAGAALRAATDGLRAAPDDLAPALRLALRSARGAALSDRGEHTAGLLELQNARSEIGDASVPVPLAATVALLEHRVAVLFGYGTAATGAAGWLGAKEGARHELTLMRAWSAAATGSFGAVRAEIAALLLPHEPPVLPTTAVEAWLLEARAALAMGKRQRARTALHTALTIAEPLDALRPFALTGPTVGALLVDQLGLIEDRRTFAARALAVRRRAAHGPAVLLSARERDVLAQLPSLRNLDEIADGLAVSVNTVKSHVRAIYAKLGVSTRRTAVLTAHEHGILR
jgi:LuxR family maltose regulon positive regulatory protein